MRVIANQINEKPIHIDLWKLERTYKKYLGKRNRAIFELYQLGVLDNPVYMDFKMVKRFLIEEFKPVMKYLVSGVDGMLMLERRQFKLASEIYKEDEDFNAFALALNDYYESQYIIEELQKIRSKIKSRMTGCDIPPRVAVSTSAVTTRCKIDFCNSGVQECVTLSDGMELKYIDLTDSIMRGIAKVVEISDEEFEQSRSENKSLFIDGITYNQELNYIDLLLTGQTVLNGRFGERLKKKIIEYYNVNFNDTDNNIGYEKFDEVVYRSCFDLREKQIGTIENSTIFRPFIADNFGIYFEIPSTNSNKAEGLYDMDTDVVYGNYCVNAETGIEFSETERLLGLCGEFVSEDYKKKNNLVCRTLPIQIDGKKYYCVTDIEGETIKPVLEDETFFEFTDINDVFGKLYIKEIQTFKSYLKQVFKRFVKEGNISDFEMNMTCEITLRYLLADWGYNYRPPIKKEFAFVSERTLEKFMELSEKFINFMEF